MKRIKTPIANSKTRIEKKKTPTPPQWATRFLSFYCRPELLEDLEGDLNEFFHRNLQTKGAFLARLIYILDVLKFLRPYTLRKPRLSTGNFMFASYVKTSTRVITRNKLFSGINIIGMSVSLSVGLLVMAYVSDLYSFDTTLDNKDRIYRVISSFHPGGGPAKARLASTSWKAGTLIQQQVPGIESMTILRNWFRGDAQIGEGKIPVTGIYADKSFFDVFSFPLVKGAAPTALKEPRSLVLTQTTATKLFGNIDPMGKVVKFDTVTYTVTGILQDLPTLSHIHFEMLVSLSSINVAGPQLPGGDGNYLDWTNFFSNYVYVLLKKNTDPAAFTAALERISVRENASQKPDRKITLLAQPLKKIPFGTGMGNEIGPVFSIIMLYVLCGLAGIILLSACFNYTNLSIARSLRRSREVGIRKVIGAQRIQVIGQFIAESVIISLASLGVAFLIFLLLRGQFLAINPDLAKTFSLSLTPRLGFGFLVLAIVVGLIAGLLPALFYSKINAVQVLKDASALKVFRHLTLRKALVVVQYTFSLIFITATVMGYHQYKSFVRFDLGFRTDNILNVRMQGNRDEVFVKELAALPAVKKVSRSLLINSLGSITGSQMSYRSDSAEIDLNYVDANYLPLHQYTFLAGHNFLPKQKDAPQTEIIVNEQLLRRFNIGHGEPAKAIGEVLTRSGKNLTIVGVLKDFHYGTLDRPINPTGLVYTAEPGGYVNIKVSPINVPATMTAVETLWKRLDPVHPLDAHFYDDQIEEAYSQFSVTLKVIGFFAALAVCISSLGLFGMVIYTLEKRVKEVSIRRVLGAEKGGLVYLLSKGFLLLLGVAAAIALPLTWLFFQNVVLANFAYHQPITFTDLFTGLFIVGGIAAAMIGIQTLKIVRANPVKSLRAE
ncbi:MAG TPA: ABC transporter permease [Puia sp.]|uniref:ABC transporter permease n=1 Tax=Puia sp. TaxID=2045100 RepID=UPI002C325F3E|nr:ABC transporter permease [Puia sp.]HVU94620.1 ABC transporter permease [Puia sp.]